MLDGIPVGLPDTIKPSAFQVAYTPKTVMIDRATQASSLISISPNGTYTFSNANGPLALLAPGKVMLLEGTDVADVTGVSNSGGHLIVKTSPAAITDLIKTGHIAFATPVNFAKAIAVTDPGAATAGSSSTPTAAPASNRITSEPAGSAFLAAAEPPAPSALFSFEGQISNSGRWRYRVTFQDGPDGLHYALTICFGLILSFTDELSAGSGHCLSPSGGFAGLGVALQFQASGVVSFGTVKVDERVGASTNSSAISFDGAHYTLHLSYALSEGTGPSTPGLHLPAFRIPFGIEYPVDLGIPLYMKLQCAFMFDLGVGFSKNSVMQASADADTTASVGGTLGEQNSSVDPGSSSHGKGSVTPGESISAAAESWVAAIQFPRFGIGLGWSLANALVYFDAVWSYGEITGSAIAGGGTAYGVGGGICDGYAFTVSFGIQGEVAVGVSHGTIRISTPRVAYPQPAGVLYEHHTPGCPAIGP
jgi:hypothetical protein